MSEGPPDGTRYVPPERAARRAEIAARLAELYDRWGYLPVEVPALERYRPDQLRIVDDVMGIDRRWVKAWRDALIELAQ